jgi:hypothetical protein
MATQPTNNQTLTSKVAALNSHMTFFNYTKKPRSEQELDLERRRELPSD